VLSRRECASCPSTKAAFPGNVGHTRTRQAKLLMALLLGAICEYPSPWVTNGSGGALWRGQVLLVQSVTLDLSSAVEVDTAQTFGREAPHEGYCLPLPDKALEDPCIICPASPVRPSLLVSPYLPHWPLSSAGNSQPISRCFPQSLGSLSLP
jgi:hypothetical protein